MRYAHRLLAAALLACAPAGCVEEVTVPEPAPLSEMRVGESRSVELRFLRFDVTDFKQELTLERLRELAPGVLEQTWLLDMDARPLVRNAIARITYMDPADAEYLPQPARNLWELVNMTAESTDLSGTKLESLIGVGKAVGLPASIILADLASVDENTRLIATEIVADAVLENVVATHPKAQVRSGLVDEAHPDGLYPVAPHSLPVFLSDVANNFESLPELFGPVAPDPDQPGSTGHPGFIISAAPIRAATDDFKMTVKVNANALPYKGVDATLADIASVNSTGGQIDTIFDFTDPTWMEIEGLAEDLRISEMTMGIYENDAFLPGGTSRDPMPLGDSPVWGAAPWQFEHLLASAGLERAQAIPAHCTDYAPQGTGEPFEAVHVCIDDTGWVEIDVDPSVILEEPPPPPAYFWDILLEVAQARLHDGGLAEGEADVEMTITDVPVGVQTEDLVTQIRTNIEANPLNMRGVAEELTRSTEGDADFYYYQAEADGADYLYFIAPPDMRLDALGIPVRDYVYQRPGFYADAELTQKVSSAELLDGDDLHEKVRIEPGVTLYFEDDAGWRYRIEVGPKPSPHRVALTLTRID